MIYSFSDLLTFLKQKSKIKKVEVNKKGTINQLCETKFLQMCSFSIIMTSLHSINLSFSQQFCVISTAIFKFPL